MEKKQPSSRVEKIYVKTSFNIPLGTDHLTYKGGGGGGGGGVFVQNFFFGQHESFFCRAKREFFFPDFNIRLYDKNSESDYYFFPPPKSEYFFQQHWKSDNIFRKKTITPPGS